MARAGDGDFLRGVAEAVVQLLIKLCKDIDDRVHAFLDRPLEGDRPYLWLDATYLKQREGGRIVSVAANTEGKREIVGLHIGPSEAETLWATFLRSLVKRGLRGTKLVISDAHEGLKGAIWRVMGATWQRCRVHWPKAQQSMASAALRQAFIQLDRTNASRTGLPYRNSGEDVRSYLSRFLIGQHADLPAWSAYRDRGVDGRSDGVDVFLWPHAGTNP